MKMCWISLFCLLSIALSGCGTSQVKVASTPNLTPTVDLKQNKSLSTPVSVIPTQMDDMPKDPPLPIPRSPGLQALIERAKADLAQRLSIPASQIKAIETQEAVWPDASLGCPQPGIDYAQFPTPGYIIMLEYGGDEFEYHASIRGNTLHCENPTPPISGTPADIYPLR
jgi:hypothetical protein